MHVLSSFNTAALPFTAVAGRSGNLSEMWFWSAILLGILLVGMVAIMFARRYLHSESNGTEGFDLESLRRLHRAGEMTDAEFEAAKAAIIGTLRGKRDEPAVSENSAEKNRSDASAEDGNADQEPSNDRRE